MGTDRHSSTADFYTSFNRHAIGVRFFQWLA